MGAAKSEIDPILQALIQEKNAKTVRKSLEQLGGLLSDSSFRQRLAAESGGPGSSIVLKRHALSLVWQNVMRVAMRAIQVLSATHKPQPVEYAQFAKLLTSFSQADVMEKDVRPKLSLEILVKVWAFVVRTFKEDTVVSATEGELFNILVAICSRTDFVGIFRPDDFDDTMDILEPRLDVEQSLECGFSVEIVDAAARALEALISTTTTIGISMHDHIATCIMWVARRCKSYVKIESGGTKADTVGNTLRRTALSLLRAATLLMRSEPEHSIGPLRTYGSVIIGIARRMYPKTSGAEKDVIVELFISYLVVCQIAGSFQGLPPGDLGDLGNGSLGKNAIIKFLDLVATCVEIKRIVHDDQINGATRKAQEAWKPLPSRRQRHLELCARLLACSQRVYLAEETWMAMKDPIDNILRFIKFDDNPGSQLTESMQAPPTQLPLRYVAQSPFVRNILAPLWYISSRALVAQPENALMSASQVSKSSLSHEFEHSENHNLDFPILKYLSDQDSVATDVDSIVPLLQLLCACAEAFPFGECWSTCTYDNWYVSRPEDPLQDDLYLIKTCSADDVALVVFLVCTILEVAGRPGGDDQIQIWSLRNLAQLAEVSACVASVTKSPLIRLCSMWQEVWHVLLRPTLRYVAFTKDATPFSRGEMIIILLERIARLGCTDLDSVKAHKRRHFLSNEVHAIWNLPTFLDALSVASPFVFVLIRSALCYAGISNDRPVGIDERIVDSLSSEIALDLSGQELQRSNRFKLLRFCLLRFCFEISGESQSVSAELLSSILVCCSVIVAGNNAQALAHADYLQFVQQHSVGFSVVKLKSTDLYLGKQTSPCLWDTGARRSFTFLDKVLGVCCHARDVLDKWCSIVSSGTVNLVSRRQISRMQRFSIDYLSALMTNEMWSNGQSQSVSILVGKTFAFRLYTTLIFCKQMEAKPTEAAQIFADEVAVFVDDWCNFLQSSVTCVDDAIPHLRNFVSGIVGWCDPSNVEFSMSMLKDVCVRLLERYNSSRSCVNEKASSAVEPGLQRDELWEDEDEDEETNVNPSKKRRISVETRLAMNHVSYSPRVQVVPSLAAASSIAAILIMLEPRLSSCNLIYSKLSVLGQSKNFERSVDVDGAMAALDVICSNSDLILDVVGSDHSLVGLCLEIIREIRHGTHGGDMHFGAGFAELALALKTNTYDALSDSILSVLSSVFLMSESKEQRWIFMRPLLQADRLSAARIVFRYCGDKFRDDFVSIFSRMVICESLDSLSVLVRLISVHALGELLRHQHDTDDIVSKIIASLVINKVMSPETPLLQTLCDAQLDRDDSPSWKQSLVSVRYTLALLWGVIAGCSSNRSTFGSRLFDCLHLGASDPSFELLCHNVIEKICSLKGYQSTDQLIADENTMLWEKIFAARIPPCSIPLNFVSTSLVTKIKYMGIGSPRTWGILESQSDCINELTLQAIAEFMSVALPSALPICLSNFSYKQLAEFVEDSHVKSELHEYIDTLITFSTGTDQSSRNRQRFLELNVSNIIAHGMLGTAKIGNMKQAHTLLIFSLELTSAAIDDFQRRSILCASIKHLLKMQGKEIDNTLDCDTYSVLFGLDAFTADDWPPVEEVVRDGAIEFLIGCRYWLDRAQVASHKESCWGTMAMLIKFMLLDQRGTVTSCEVAFRTMISVLQASGLRCCHSLAVALIRDSLEAVIDRILVSNTSELLLIPQLVVTLLQVHERCQAGILLCSPKVFRARKYDQVHCSNTICSAGKTTGLVTGLARTGGMLDQHRSICHLDQSLGICAEEDESLAMATYNLIEKLLQVWTSSKVHRSNDTNADIATFICDDDRLNTLSSMDKKFVAQTLFRDITTSPSAVSNPRDRLRVAMSRFVSFKVKLFPRNDSGYHIDDLGSREMNARLLLNHTIALKTALIASGGAVASTDTYHVSHHLLEMITDKGFPTELREEGTRCLGLVGSAVFEELLKLGCNLEPEFDWLNVVGTDSASLMAFTISMVLAFLVDRVQRESPLIVIACLEACNEIARTQDGVIAIRCMTTGNCKSFMESLQSKVDKKKPNLLTPSDMFVDDAIRISTQYDGVRQDGWCWSDALWEAGRGSYDDWIKRLVSSIIICSYRVTREVNESCVRGRSLSFRAFAKIAAMSSTIATYLFPRVMLDLLLSDTQASRNESQIFKTVEESWIGNPHSISAHKISSAIGCLAASLEKCTDEEFNRKASTLVSFTYNLLRRISQRRFLDYFRRQPVTSIVPGSKSQKTPCRFGSVLAIKPEATAQIFIASGKVASAIYYAETALSETEFCAFARNECKWDPPNLIQRTPHTALMPILRDCMVFLRETDEASAYALNMASRGFLGEGFVFLDHSQNVAAQGQSLDFLRGGKDRGEDKKILDVANSLQALGSSDALRAFLDSVYRQQHISENTKASLKETWYLTKLTAIDWTEFPDMFVLDGHAHKGPLQGFFESLSGALASLSNEDIDSFEESLSICRSQVLSQCSIAYGMESPLSCALTQIGYFEILNDFEMLASDAASVPSILKRWDKESVEPNRGSVIQGRLTLALREIIVSILQTTHAPKHDLEEYFSTLQWRNVSIARDLGEVDFAERCLRRLEKRMSTKGVTNVMVSMRLRVEEAQLIECRGYYKEAIQITKLIVQTVDSELMNSPAKFIELMQLKADSLLLCGAWTRKHEVESAKYVQEHYLLPAAGACHDLWTKRESFANRKRLSLSCLALAESAAKLFDNVYSRITSKEWKGKASYLEEQRRLVCQLDNPSGDTVAKTPKEISNLKLIKKLIGRLEDEKAALEEELGPYACLALQAYGEALSFCDRSSSEHWTSHVFRMISIWFSTHLVVPEVNASIDAAVKTIPTYRFLPLTYQLLSRLNSHERQETDHFQTTLSKLVGLMCQQHPYHCLPQLLTLIHGQEDRLIGESTSSKTQAAFAIMNSLRQAADSNKLELYNTYDAITLTYHSLAMALPSERHKKQRRGIPIKDFLKRNDFRSILKGAKCVPCVLTRPPIVVENHDYGGFMMDPPGTELMKEIHPECCLAPSGLTRPKIIVCVGSRGTLFKQLVKGNDDIRQDAIMQQVFTYSNELMQRRTIHNRTKRCNETKVGARSLTKTLKLLTYHVIPLSPKSGILEWVDNTQPFLDYLQDKGKKQRGAHSRYWAGEWSFELCMEEMTRASSSKHGEKRATFDRICENVSPVFRFFFVEMFAHDLQAWHTAKMAYTRTCAVSSIVGHVLGIGDRHANNLLVHQKTGELVHIDFGIVFEQGRLLPTPETVPFRLTRDIVDGMGPLGTEGTFTAAAEETNRILRENSDTLLTILSGVVSDPQYEWRKGVSKARARQEGEDCTRNSDKGILLRIERAELVHDPTDSLAAKHTVARIKEKLQGYEDGTSSEQHSVEGQVQLLINCAQDHDNLCVMWRGWAPWL